MSRFSDPTDGPRSIPIVLASGSPRRRELVERIGFDPKVRVSEIPEQRRPEENGDAYAARLAQAKAKDVAADLDGPDGGPNWLLAADTVVARDDDILEKPEDAQHAVEMLSEMVGGWHRVLTSFCWLNRQEERRWVETVETDVRMRDVSEAFIRRYVATGEPMDKAGSYGIQEFGSLLVRELRGSYFNVVGLPICEVIEAVEEMDALELHPLVIPESDSPEDEL